LGSKLADIDQFFSALILLPNLSHFAMWQDAEAFNAAVLKYLDMK
jgi:pimeloyl-ACP methyl ester carboxylesterase